MCKCIGSNVVVHYCAFELQTFWNDDGQMEIQKSVWLYMQCVQYVDNALNIHRTRELWQKPKFLFDVRILRMISMTKLISYREIFLPVSWQNGSQAKL